MNKEKTQEDTKMTKPLWKDILDSWVRAIHLNRLPMVQELRVSKEAKEQLGEYLLLNSTCQIDLGNSDESYLIYEGIRFNIILNEKSERKI